MKTIVLLFVVLSAKLFAQQDSSTDLPQEEVQNNIIQTEGTTQITGSNTDTAIAVPAPRRSQVNSQTVRVDTAPVLEENNDSSIVKTLFDTLLQSARQSETSEVLLQPRKRQTDYVMPVLLLALLIYFTILRYQYAKQLKENITVLFNRNLGLQIFRDREFSANLFNVLLYVNALLVIGIYLFQLTKYFGFPLPFHNNFINMLLCIAVFPVLYMLKGLLYFGLKQLFRLDTALEFFRFNTLVIYQLLAVCLLPFVILIYTTKEPVLYWVVVTSLCLTGLALALRILKGIFLGIGTGTFPVLYFLLYICAFEIAPVLLAFKLYRIYAM
jgi:hypothetical protein